MSVCEVPGRVVAEEAQVQPAPPLERPVARPGVAAEPAEQAGDVPVEIDRPSADPSGSRTGFGSSAPRRPGRHDAATRSRRPHAADDRSHRPGSLVASLISAPARRSPPRSSPRGA